MDAGDDDHPILSKQSAHCYCKSLLPRSAPKLKLKNYYSMKSCTKWLGELASRTTWVMEMQTLEDL